MEIFLLMIKCLQASTRYIDPALFSKYFTGSRLTKAILLNDRQIGKRTAPTGGGKRGSPKENDACFSVNIKIGITLGRERIKRY